MNELTDLLSTAQSNPGASGAMGWVVVLLAVLAVVAFFVARGARAELAHEKRQREADAAIAEADQAGDEKKERVRDLDDEELGDALNAVLDGDTDRLDAVLARTGSAPEGDDGSQA